MHRIGLIVPSSNTTMETEVPWLLRERERERPEDRFAIHSARPAHAARHAGAAAGERADGARNHGACGYATGGGCYGLPGRRIHRGRRDTTWAILHALKLEPVVPGAGTLLGPAFERVV